MSNQKELGVSSQEYEDAVILETLYSLISHHNCSACKKKKPSHIDCNQFKLICKSCSKGKDYCKEIGGDRITSRELKKLQKRYRNSSNRNNRASNYKTQSKPNKTRSSFSDIDAESDYDYNGPYSNNQYHSTASAKSQRFIDPSFHQNDPSIPGMRNLLMNQPNQIQSDQFIHQQSFPPHTQGFNIISNPQKGFNNPLLNSPFTNNFQQFNNLNGNNHQPMFPPSNPIKPSASYSPHLYQNFNYNSNLGSTSQNPFSPFPNQSIAPPNSYQLPSNLFTNQPNFNTSASYPYNKISNENNNLYTNPYTSILSPISMQRSSVPRVAINNNTSNAPFTTRLYTNNFTPRFTSQPLSEVPHHKRPFNM